MRRRSTSEIQVDYDRDIYNPEDTTNYDLLIPKYPEIEHNDTYNSTAANDSISDGINYNRDNYYIIPYKVPPMTFIGAAYPLSWDALHEKIPTVSIARNTNYDKNIWPVNDSSPANLWVGDYKSFSSVVIAAYPFFTNVLNASLYVCNSSDDGSTGCVRNTGYPDYINHPNVYQCGPLDKISNGYLGISEAFGYAWSDSWDMNLVVSPVKYGNTTITEDSSSSSSDNGGCNVYLCKISSPPSGAGGAATVTVITVDGSGNVNNGRSIIANFPAI
jgi:hypothetical protein